MARGPAVVSRHENVRQARPKAIDFFSGSEDGVKRVHSCTNDDEIDSDDQDTDGEQEDTDEEAPRVVQWIDEEDLDMQDQTGDALTSEGTDDDDRSASEAGPSYKLQSLQDDLSTLPLGTLRSAQRSLAQAHALYDSESDSEGKSLDDLGASDSEDDDRPTKGKDKVDSPSKAKSAMTKRANKHAPIEVTSKRPVSRRRVVIDDTLPKPRDPRFMHAAGRYDPSKFKHHYDFLSGLHSDELSTLREHMKRAQKFVANSPSHLRNEREDELKRLERAMKKAESAVNLDNRDRVESKALQTAKQVEQEKRKQGKAGWWMKRSEKKALLDKARLDAIASAGGKQAVKKAVEKKQKKISQREKRMRPFPRKETDGKRRRLAGLADAGRALKRRKVT